MEGPRGAAPADHALGRPRHLPAASRSEGIRHLLRGCTLRGRRAELDYQPGRLDRRRHDNADAPEGQAALVDSTQCSASPRAGQRPLANRPPAGHPRARIYQLRRVRMAEFDTVIRNGVVVTAADVVEADVGITGGVITALGRGLGPARRELDAAGRYVTPGRVYTHRHSHPPIRDSGTLARHLRSRP